MNHSGMPELIALFTPVTAGSLLDGEPLAILNFSARPAAC